MEADLDRRIEELFHEVASLPAALRASFLAERCSDSRVRQGVEILLRHDELAKNRFLARATFSPLKLEDRHDPILRDILDRAAEVPAEQRAAFLDSACGSDVALRAEAESLLAALDRAASILPDGPISTSGNLIRAIAQAVSKRTRLVGAKDELLGARVGRYKVLEWLGEGGMGVVYLAEQEQPLRRQVALKIIKPGMDSAGVIARFNAERQALAVMDHPNIARVYDAGATDAGRPYFVMELVRGAPVTRYCDEKQLTVRQRLELFVTICQAIQHAHQKGIIHRDIKASNVLAYASDGNTVVKVIDFGIAKALAGERPTAERALQTLFGQVIGTYAYMSPEQVEGNRDIDTRTDVYSLGVLLYELLAGALPFDESTFANAANVEIRRIIREVEPPRPSARLSSLGEQAAGIAAARGARCDALTRQLRSELEWIPLMAMRKERERRYPSAQDLAGDVQHYLENRPLSAGPESLAYRLRKYVSRNRAAVAAVATIVALLLGGSIFSTSQWLRARQAEDTVGARLIDVRAQRDRAEEELHEHYVDRGIAAWEQNEPATAVLWFAKALKLDRPNSVRERSDRIRISTSLWTCPRPVVEPAGTFSRWCRQAEDFGTLSALVRKRQSVGAQTMPASLSHLTNVTAAGRSGSFDKIVASTGDKITRVWDAKTGQPVTPPMVTQDVVVQAGFSFTEQYVVTITSRGAAQVWDRMTGRALTTSLDRGGKAKGASISRNGRRVLVAVAGDTNTYTLLDTGTGDVIAPPIHAPAPVNFVTWSDDGNYLATGIGSIFRSDLGVQVWDVRTAQPIASRVGPGCAAIEFELSKDGTYLRIIQSRDKFWRVRGFAEPVKMKHAGAVRDARFSHDGSRIVTTSEDGTAVIRDPITGNPTAPILKHDGAINYVEFSVDGRYVVTASEDGTARVWNSDSGGPVGPPMLHEKPVGLATLSPDGSRVLTLSGWPQARVWDAKTGRQIGRTIEGDDGIVSAIGFSKDGKYVVTIGSSGVARTWDATTGQRAILPIAQAWNTTSPNRFSPDGKRVLVKPASTRATTVRDAGTGARLSPEMTHDGLLECCQFGPDGAVVLTCGDTTARLWDSVTGKPVAPAMEHRGGVRYATMSRDGAYVVTGSYQAARVWDAHAGKPVTPPLKHSATVTRAQFSPDGNYVLTVCYDGAAQLWPIAGSALPAEQVGQLGEVLSVLKIDDTGGITGMDLVEWTRLRDRFWQEMPDFFGDPRRTPGTAPSATMPAIPQSAGRSFRFKYDFADNERSNRYWRGAADGTWVEQYEISGQQTTFKTVGRIDDGGRVGTVVRRSDGRLEVFIPDATGEWLECRNLGQGGPTSPWRRLARTEEDD